MSQNEQEFRRIWQVRESIAMSAVKEGKVIAYDVSYDVSSWN